MDRRTKYLNIFYWVLVLLVGLSLFAEMHSVAGFIALVVLVSQLSEIATYLQHLLIAKARKGEALGEQER